MGGQPEIVLGADQVYRWSWRLNWYSRLADLHAARPTPLVDAADLATEGRPITAVAGRGRR
jgi:hypothetical protein